MDPSSQTMVRVAAARQPSPGSINSVTGKSFCSKQPLHLLQPLHIVVLVAASIFSLTVEDEPRVMGNVGDIKAADVDAAKAFIRLNKDTLEALWADDIDVYDAIPWEKV